MMKKNVLAKKILCGLLAAGVLGVSGSAMAADVCSNCANHTHVINSTHNGEIFNATETGYMYGVLATSNKETIVTSKIVTVSTENSYAIGAVGGTTKITADTVKVKSNRNGINAYDNNSNIYINAKTLDISGVTKGLYAERGHIDITSDDINIQSNKSGIVALDKTSDISIKAKTLTINSVSEGLLVQSNTQESQAPDDSAKVTINADKISIGSSSAPVTNAILAFSNAQIDINGDLTVDAANALNVRGNSTVNINAESQHTTVLNGDVVFETPNSSGSTQGSGNIINANVNINLDGENSSWTGRAYQEYNNNESVDLTAPDYYGSVTGFKMNISNGASWNMTGDSFINNVNVADGGAVNVQENVKVFNAGDVALNKGNLNIKGENTEGNEQKITINKLSNDAGTIDMQGSAQNLKINDLTSNDSTINMQGATQTIDVTNTFNSNGTNINLQGEQQKLNLTSMSGSGATVNTNSLDNKVNISEKANETQIAVHGSSAVTDEIASGKASLQDLANVVTHADEEKTDSLADTVTSAANDIIGGYSAEVGKDGKIIASTQKTIENPTNRAVSDMASISLMTWRAENNDMNKRLGELRDSKGEHGAWARMARGESKYGAQNVKNQYNYYQVGYDEKLSVNPNWTVGVALTRTEGNSTFATGSGENKHTGVALYGSYLNDNGSFIDLIAKYARMDNDYKTIGAGVGDADYKANGYSISAEYGKRFTKDNGFWIEPQVELTYGTVGSVNYTTSKGAQVYQESVDSLVGRLGFSLGKNIKQGNVYVRASYLYDFDGETKATMTKAGAGAASFEQDLGGGWWEVGVGTNINLSDATHLYFDVEKTYGGNVATPWQWNAGVRWSF